MWLFVFLSSLLVMVSCSHVERIEKNKVKKQLHGGVERIEVRSRKDVFQGKKFGEIGQYEYLDALVTIAVDPNHPHNSTIVDLNNAPKRNDKLVEFKVNIGILVPKSADRARRVMIMEPVNRGRRASLSTYFNEGSTTLEKLNSEGNGFFMRNGYTVVYVGWQGDLPLSEDGKILGTLLPVANKMDGSSIVGNVRDEWIFDNWDNTVDVKLSYPATQSQLNVAYLRVKQRQSHKWNIHKGWKWVDEKTIQIKKSKKFDAGAIYEFIYEAKDPPVMGLGFLAVRELGAFLKYENNDLYGNLNPLNLLRGSSCKLTAGCDAGSLSTIDVAILEGISQSGRFVRDFIWQNFNRDVEGRKIFDGAIPIAAGSRKSWTNSRFAQPSRWSREHEDHLQMGDQFPFAYSVLTDLDGRNSDGILRLCSENGSCPKIFHIDGSAEFWQARASLVGTDLKGRDMPFPDNVRAYLMSSTQHIYLMPGILEAPKYCVFSGNVVRPGSTVRALTIALVDWIERDVVPPESQWPRVSQGELVSPVDSRRYILPNVITSKYKYAGTHNFISPTDYTHVPPKVDIDRLYKVKVPAIDNDGNDLSGIKTPDVSVPLGTHLPWNIRAEGFAQGALCGGFGSFLQFAKSTFSKTKTNDNRYSLEERYEGNEHYRTMVKEAVKKLINQRHMLPGDEGLWNDKINIFE